MFANMWQLLLAHATGWCSKSGDSGTSRLWFVPYVTGTSAHCGTSARPEVSSSQGSCGRSALSTLSDCWLSAGIYASSLMDSKVGCVICWVTTWKDGGTVMGVCELIFWSSSSPLPSSVKMSKLLVSVPIGVGERKAIPVDVVVLRDEDGQGRGGFVGGVLAIVREIALFGVCVSGRLRVSSRSASTGSVRCSCQERGAEFAVRSSGADCSVDFWGSSG